MAGARYIHPGLTALHISPALQAALGIKTLDIDHLLQLLHSAHAQSMLAGLGGQWCAAMLACIFDILAGKHPQLHSMQAQDARHSAAMQSVCNQLTSLPLFPLTTGAWAAVGRDPDQPLFRAAADQPVGEDNADPAKGGEQTQHVSTCQSLEGALKTCHLTLQDMQMQVVAADFVQEDASGSLSKMLQAGPHCPNHALHGLTL